MPKRDSGAVLDIAKVPYDAARNPVSHQSRDRCPVGAASQFSLYRQGRQTSHE